MHSTKLFESNEFKQMFLNQMKVKHIQTKHFEGNDSQIHSTKLFESNESQTHSNKGFLTQMKVKCIQQSYLN